MKLKPWQAQMLVTVITSFFTMVTGISVAWINASAPKYHQPPSERLNEYRVPEAERESETMIPEQPSEESGDESYYREMEREVEERTGIPLLPVLAGTFLALFAAFQVAVRIMNKNPKVRFEVTREEFY